MTATVCIICGHPMRAATPEGLAAAGEAHADYVNHTADRQTDPHFEDLRLEALITDGR